MDTTMQQTLEGRQYLIDQKVNLLISFLATKQVLDEREVAQLKQFQIFPAPPKVGS